MRVTRVGVAILAVLATCVLLTIFGSGAVQAAALVIGALIVLALAAEGAGRSGASELAQDPDLAQANYRRKQEIYERDADTWRRTHSVDDKD